MGAVLVPRITQQHLLLSYHNNLVYFGEKELRSSFVYGFVGVLL